ncbi:putative polyketide synthase [Leptodontidium sp. MPI-SDFR-AT-0119]|nr:putative polyketide synthase [Leptodontidium sp. MPI-SDFR-AT-0119]
MYLIHRNGKVEGMGITHPSVEGQGRVLRTAYKKANLDPNKTAYAECHGTGTLVGDPIEVRAIATAMNDTRSRDRPLRVGAVKANIGHSGAASGIFAVMKGALMTEAGIIPGVCGFKNLNPEIREKEWNVRVNVDTIPWPSDFSVRRASVSSFGYGGTNGYVIIEAVESLYPWYEHGKPKTEASYNNEATRPFLLSFSAHDKATLVRNIDAHAKVASQFYLSDLAYTIAVEGEEAKAFDQATFTFVAPKKSNVVPLAMQNFPSFLETIRALDRLEALLLAPKDVSRLSEAEIAQPICTTVQIAIVDLLANWDVSPSVTVGHSSGEIGSAYAAGLLSAPEAIIPAYYRGLAVKEFALVGAMLAVGLGAHEVSKYLKTDEVVVACENSPNSTTLSGTESSIQAVKEQLDSEKMNAVAPHYEKLLHLAYQSIDQESLSWRQPRVMMISSVTGEEYKEDYTPFQYWSANLRSRVLFDTAVTSLGNHPDLVGVSCMVEIGPHSALAGPFKQICLANEFSHFKYIPTLVRNSDAAIQLLKTAGELLMNNYPINLEQVNAINESENGFGIKSKRGPRILVDLPPYQHDLLGSQIAGLSDHALVWKNQLRHRDVPWLKDHQLGNSSVFPAAGHMSMAIEALWQVIPVPMESVTLRDVDIKTALIIPETDNGMEVQVRFQQLLGSEYGKSTKWYSFTVESITDDVWTIHCQGRIAANQASQHPSNDSPVKPSRLTQRVPGKRWYDSFHRVGFQYAGSFQPLISVKSNGKDRHAAATMITATESNLMIDESRYILHPSTVDACLQLIIISINRGLHKEMPWSVVPIRIEEATLYFPGEDAGTIGNATAWSDNPDGRYFNTNTKIESKSGKVLLDVKNLRCVAYEAAVPQVSTEPRVPEPYMEVKWKPDIARLDPFQKIDQSVEQTVSSLAGLIHHKSGLKNFLLLGVSSLDLFTALRSCIPDANFVMGVIDQEHLEALDAAKFGGGFTAFILPTDPSSWRDFVPESPDLLMLDSIIGQKFHAADLYEAIKELVAEDGRIMERLPTCSESSIDSRLTATNLGTVALKIDLATESILLFTMGTYQNGIMHAAENLSIVSLDPQSAELLGFQGSMSAASESPTQSIDIASVDTAISGKIIIHDMDGTLLSTLDRRIFDGLKRVFTSEEVTGIVWVTAGVNEGKNIPGAMAQGFLRALRSERASIKVSLLDIDSTATADAVLPSVMLDLLQSVGTKDSGTETKFWLRSSGILEIPRIVPNPSLNNQFPIADTPVERSVLSNQHILSSNFNNRELIFHTQANSLPELGLSDIEIQPSLFGVTKLDFQRNKERPDIIVGNVTKTGRDADFSLLGKAVVVYATNAYSTRIRVHEDSIILIDDLQIAAAVATLGPLTSAYNAVFANGHVKKGDHTRNTPSIVIGSEFSPLAQEIWRSLPSGGRFVLNDGTLTQEPDTGPFMRGVSLVATGVDTLLQQGQSAADNVLKTTVQLLRDNETLFSQTPVKYDVSTLQVSTLQDKAVASYDYGSSMIMILEKPEMLTFSPESAYLLVGCLGGLGRSLTAFMMERGCMNFVFISRSGADKLDVALLVQELKEAGASVKVYRGDASSEADVTGIVSQVKTTHDIRGVVHAAMVLEDGMFEGISYESFTAAIKPKVLGTLNLHNALKDTTLDFFVMTSSISAVLGNPGQSNYSAANSYLDSLAWHRNKHGLAATSLTLPMVLDVGVVSENENIELSLLRKGIAQIICGLEPSFLAAAVSSTDAVDPYWYNDARLSGIRSTVEIILKSSTSSSGSGSGNFVSSLKALAAEGMDAILQAIVQHTIAKCSSILMVPVEDFEFDGRSIASYGLDSMIGHDAWVLLGGMDK